MIRLYANYRSIVLLKERLLMVCFNFDEVGGELAQFQRLLRIETRPFQEVHFTINGTYRITAYAYRPYKN